MEGLDKERPLSLYIHVPFCLRKCDYCAFYSLPSDAVDADAMDRYLDIILGEISALNREWGKPYHTVFIGGGNPGMLGFSRLKCILSLAQENGRADETTIEINPESLSDGIQELDGLLTRVSVGIQSLDDRTLRTLGRSCGREASLRALSLLSKLPFSFNADIITAVPGQSIAGTLQDIEEICAYGPDHISFYCLTFEEGTPLSRRSAPLSGEEEAGFLSAGWARLRSLGYRHYEISNFAREGKECLHNRVYWELGQYVGFGPGAESSIGYPLAVSMRDSETLEAFLARPEMSVTFLSEDETKEELLLTALRTVYGIDKEEYRRRFSEDFTDRYGAFISRLDRSWYADSGERFALTEEGFMFLDRIILELAMAI